MNRTARFSLVVSLVVSLVGCASSLPAPAPGAAAGSAPASRHDGPQNPLSLQIDALRTAAHSATLRVTVRKLTPAAAELSATLPAGVTASGAAATLPADFVGERAFVVELQWDDSRLPTQDVVFSVAAQGRHSGAMARGWYRFGRALPEVAPTATQPVKLRAGRMLLTESVPLAAGVGASVPVGVKGGGDATRGAVK